MKSCNILYLFFNLVWNEQQMCSRDVSREIKVLSEPCQLFM